MQLFENIKQLVTCADVAQVNSRAVVESDLACLSRAYLAVEEGVIVAIGNVGDAQHDRLNKQATSIIDCRSYVCLPGFIDCHTHPVWGGNRGQEFAQKISGKTYQQIAAEGGGIRYTVAQTRLAKEEELFLETQATFDHFFKLGVTTCEAKSGYGLSTAAEIKSLEVIQRAAKHTPLDVHATFLGAHAVPQEMTTEAYIDQLCSEMLPAVIDKKLASACDVFIEEGYFNYHQGRRILERAQHLGMATKVHADEFTHGRGAQLAAQLGCLSADHLQHSTKQDIAALAASNTVAVMLPGTAFYSNIACADATRFLEGGCRLAIASDFNPGSCVIDNLHTIMNIAAVKQRIPVAQIIASVTLNAAYALGIQDLVGSIEVGKIADLVFMEIPDFAYFIYHSGRNFVRLVVKNGKCFRVETTTNVLST